MKKYSILMYNFNNYEMLREPEELDSECEYIYVTDNENLKSDKWKIIVDKELDGLSTFDKCYAVRFNLFKYATTDVCFYMDGSFQIHKSMRKLYDDFMASGADIGLHIHYSNTTIFDEYKTWCRCRNYPVEQANKCIKWMIEQGYDFNYQGLYEGSFRICRNTELNKKIDGMTLYALKHLGKDNEIERLDQTVYSFILNRYFNDKKVFAISPKFFYTGILSHCLHNSNKEIPYGARYEDKGMVFNNLTNLYTGENKKYKAIISLTTWKKRIETTPKTIYSLIKNCPGFHIVLVLSENEFSTKYAEIPEALKDLEESDLIEILWVKENTKTFKKVIPTMEKYPDIPIISADDGCLYYRNYAEELYNLWLQNKSCVISYNNFGRKGIVFGGGGSGIIFPPSALLGDFVLTNKIIETGHDDFYYGCITKLKNIQWKFINIIAKDSNFTPIKNFEKGVSWNFQNGGEDRFCDIIKSELKM